MNTNVLAVLIQEGSKIASELLKNHRAQSATQPQSISLEKFLEESDIRMKPFTATAPPEELPPEEPPQTTNLGPSQVINVNVPPPEKPEDGKASSIVSGCVPCAMGHFGTCVGILNESIRFAHTPEGMASPEVADRVGMCLDELNAMERVDLRPEMTVQLSGWEKDLAEKALTESRAIRHSLEALEDVDGLEAVAAKTQASRQEIGRSWFQNKLKNLGPEDKEEISRRVMAKIEEMAQTSDGGE